MHNIEGFFKWLQQSPLGLFISESDIVFPWIESLHVLAITFVVGTIAVVDLRLLGFGSGKDTIRRLNAEVVPWTIGAFVLAAITGSLLFISAAERYYANGFFRAKMLLLVGAGINMLLFHFVWSKDAAQWQDASDIPLSAKMAGGVSLLFWVVIVVCGRWVGFTL
jgi:ABC-type uncharacterized transport system permease subunit